MAFQMTTWDGLTKEVGFPESVCLAAPLVGAVLLLTLGKSLHTGLAGFFFVQPAFNPFGLLGIPIIPIAVIAGIDGECLTDGPMMSWMAQGFWFAISGTIGVVILRLRRLARHS